MLILKCTFHPLTLNYDFERNTPSNTAKYTHTHDFEVEIHAREKKPGETAVKEM